MEESEFFRRLSELAIGVGANLQAGQELVVVGDVEHAPLVREIMRAGWLAGAGDVQVFYREPYDRRFLGEYAGDELLVRSSFSQLAFAEHLGGGEHACVYVDGEADPSLYDGVAHERMARITPFEYRRRIEELGSRHGFAWTLVPFPTPAWASRVFGEPDMDRLRGSVSHAIRLDEPDPVAAWRTHVSGLAARAESLNARKYDGLRFHGPKTDLFVGLLPNSSWMSAEMTTAWGQTHVANMPTEEVATTPDWRRTHGEVAITRPFTDVGAYVTDAVFHFEHGRLLRATARQGETWLRQMLDTDAGASRVGEIALVPALNRVAELDLIFLHGLFDENVSSHMALGNAYTDTVAGSEQLSRDEREARGMSTSVVHYDFMIGGPTVDVLGVRADGSEEPVLLEGVWVLGE